MLLYLEQTKMLHTLGISELNISRVNLLLHSRNWFSTIIFKSNGEDDQKFSGKMEYMEYCMQIRNRSRLLEQHRNRLKDEVPYNQACSWIHHTEKFQRKTFGRYGLASGVNSRICFNTQQDFAKNKMLEHVACPYAFSEMVLRIQNDRKQIKSKIEKREVELAVKLEKLEQWKSELAAKIAKKEFDVLAAKERRDRLIEEVRRHFGFKVDPRDERFKEMLEQKEKEDRKKMKEAKRKVKEEKMMAKLIEKNV